MLKIRAMGEFKTTKNQDISYLIFFSTMKNQDSHGLEKLEYIRKPAFIKV